MFGRFLGACNLWLILAQPGNIESVPAEAAKPIVLRNSLLVCFSIFVPHIAKSTIFVTDPVGSPLLLLSVKIAKLLDIDTLLLPANKPVWIYLPPAESIVNSK